VIPHRRPRWGGAIGLALLTIGCSSVRAAEPTVGAAGANVRVLHHDTAEGFVLWEARPTRRVESGVYFVANNPREFERHWRQYELPLPVPEVSFDRNMVLAFTERDLCYRGLGGSELSALHIWNDGHWQPEFARPRHDVACPDADTMPRTFLYVLVVPRRLMLDDRPPKRMIQRSVAEASEAARSSCSPDPGPYGPKTRTKHPFTHLDIPQEAGIYLRALSDGTPVFVARRENGEVHVFASDVRLPERSLAGKWTWRGRRAAVTWVCGTRRFNVPSLGTFDEFGRPVVTLQHGHIDEYAVSMREDGSVVVRSDSRHPSKRPGPVTPGSVGTGRLAPFENWPLLDLHQAKSLAPGERGKVRAFFFLADHRAQLCDEQPPECMVCPSGDAFLEDVSVSGEGLVVDATLAVRRTEHGFDEVVWIGPWLESLERQRPPARVLSSRVGASGLVGYVVGESHAVGGDGWFVLGAVRDWPRPGPGESRTPAVLNWMVGDGIGVGLHGRLLAESESTTTAWIGFEPSFEVGSYLRRTVTPSVLGAVVPQLGVALESDGSAPYLGWTVPIEWRLVPAWQRRHPYSARDVMALRGGPFALLPLTDGGPAAVLGLSLGLAYASF
jgi:hypothetical protein